jgi:hypothetical protein
MGQSSSTCILVVDLIVYLKLHLLCVHGVPSAKGGKMVRDEFMRSGAKKYHEI